MVMRPDVEVFSALADPTRLDLVERLQRADGLATTELAQGTGLSRQAVKKHLDVLAHAGLVTDTRSGRRRIWRLDPSPLRSVQSWAEGIRTQWETRFNQLDAFLLQQGDETCT